MLVYDPFFSLLYVCFAQFIDLYSFAYGYQVVPTPFIVETVFPPVNCSGTHVRNHLTLNIRIYLWAFSSVPLTYMAIFMPVPQCLELEV